MSDWFINSAEPDIPITLSVITLLTGTLKTPGLKVVLSFKGSTAVQLSLVFRYSWFIVYTCLHAFAAQFSEKVNFN